MKRVLRMSYLVAGLGGVGFFVMSILLLGVWPGQALQEQIRQTKPDRPLALTASEKRGRVIYAREGCAYCHTQQIRYLSKDVARFGAATLAWETIFDYPHLWGTRRIGPDLSREATVRSSDWQLSHLYAPRALVVDSVMPAFPWLFDGAPDRPKQEARDLLDYLETLGRNRALAGTEGEAHARNACNCSQDEKQFAFGSPVLNASPSLPRRKGDFPKLARSSDLKLFQLEDIGPSYALTLAAWRERFHRHLPAVCSQGYDERFVRMWDFYLAYCESGFRERSTGDVQMLLVKPGCRSQQYLSNAGAAGLAAYTAESA